MLSATYWMIISGVFGALSNLCMRKSMDAKGSVFAFFFFQLLLTFIVCCIACPIRTNCYSINLYTILIGLLTGMALGLLKCVIGFALKKGPAGLTFVSVNMASVAPAFIITFFFSQEINFYYTTWQLIGSVLIVIGLIWAVWNHDFIFPKWKWIIFAMLGFCAHTVYLILIQSNIFILENHHWLDAFWRIGSEELHSEWHVPVIFGTACVMHMTIYAIGEKRMPSFREIIWGILGGICNGICAMIFMHALSLASGVERSFIFPIFSISLIVSCNIWAQYLYQERVNWRANGLCLLGLFAGSA